MNQIELVDHYYAVTDANGNWIMDPDFPLEKWKFGEVWTAHMLLAEDEPITIYEVRIVAEYVKTEY